MRDKVALNLPVVMTKRTNKKLAQDNPFFSISVEEEGGQLYLTQSPDREQREKYILRVKVGYLIIQNSTEGL